MKALITIITSACLLVACGGGTGSSDDTPAPPDTAPATPEEAVDTDDDGIPDSQDDDIDGDGVRNINDAFVFDASEWLDTDRDGTGDNADTDDDNDGFLDTVEIELGTDPLDEESFPADLDGDGIPDVLDDDIDNDGTPNAADAFPLDPLEQSDSDLDGIGDVADPDDDNDGYPDTVEVVAGTDPLDASSHPDDLDGDGIPDATDSDIDGDGYLNGDDDLPLDPNEWLDTDGDLIGNNTDTDDDNDGYSDSDEVEADSDPLDVNDKPADLDGDFIPDVLDDDIDGDGVLNGADAYPYDPERSEPDVVTEPTELDTELLALIADIGFDPSELTGRVVPQPGDALVELGKELFFSRSLSFGDDVACASCHDPRLAGTDNLSLPVGVGAHNPLIVGPGRRHDGNYYIDPKADFGPNVPRNSPTTFNIAFYDRAMFWDGRIETIEYDAVRSYYVGTDRKSENGKGELIRTPDSHFGGPDTNAGENLTVAQARFPVTSVDEMRGFSPAAGSSSYDTRELLASKLLARGWESYFREAFGDYISSDEGLITYDRIAFALGEYQRSQVALDNPFFEYLSGNLGAINSSAKRGAIAFFRRDRASCSGCHSGPHFSDENYYPLATPQIGRGKNVFSQDFGRYNVVADSKTKYSFRTPSLLNVALTEPYMHAGSIADLKTAVKWHFDPVSELYNYDFSLDHLAQFSGLGLDTSEHQRQVDSIASQFTSWKATNSQRSKVKLGTIDDTGLEDYVALLRSLSSACLTDHSCTAKWMPDYTEPSPDGMRLEPVFSFFDNSEIFSISEPSPEDPVQPAFPDLSGVLALDLSQCSLADVTSPLQVEITPGFKRANLLSFLDSHEIGYQVLSDVRSLAETALVIGSIAAADLDGDCDFDLAIGLGDKKGIKIYINQNGQFQKAVDNFGLDTRGDIAAFSITDINGDGWPDIFVGHLYETDSKLWLNNGGSGFIRVTEFGHNTIRTTHNAAFADVDSDGDLDLFSSNWDTLSMLDEVHLWENDGRGFFTPRIDDGTYGDFGSRDYTFTPSFTDIDKDGITDLLVAADFRTTQVFSGLGDGVFENITDSDVITDRNAMGSALGDYDNDGDLDWFVTNIHFNEYDDELINRFYRNDSSSQEGIIFSEIAVQAGVSEGDWGWGACMKDFDNDGWLDIFQVNGFGYDNSTFGHPIFDVIGWVGVTDIYALASEDVSSLIESALEYFSGFEALNSTLGNRYSSESDFTAELIAIHTAAKVLARSHGRDTGVLADFHGTPARLYMNNKDGTFREEAALRHIDDTGEGRGIACNDFDRDGDIDIVIMNHNGFPSYYENHFRRLITADDNFLNVRLRGVGGNQFAYGAKVYATSETLNQYREMRFENNYMSNNAPELHFGLAGDDAVSELRVEWPDGEVTILSDVPVNQFMVIEHPSYND
ncbi:MAG: hypothetical protein C9355_02055 [Thalassolituus maritimus]|uniref:Cytochrome c peroxidase n=1 Tax=Thalassolituus maritimus TaxID=484498 RepID=A0A1N7J3C2_9GAMM|nr:FG-GAP-like repeat-containing protein [Thalassolituus maritimus]TPD55664.1 MAG: hypothetical protein C9355_02055 [Thalassolituus maritimus]SIS43799.1 Cytochrome c peroxidase [Thalassolituus maritimus]